MSFTAGFIGKNPLTKLTECNWALGTWAVSCEPTCSNYEKCKAYIIQYTYSICTVYVYIHGRLWEENCLSHVLSKQLGGKNCLGSKSADFGD